MIPLLEGEENLKTLLIDKNWLTRLDNLISLPMLEVIDLSHNKISDISEIKILAGLKTVCLGFNWIEYIESIRALTKLKELDLQRNKIFNVPADTFKPLINLQRLNISFNYLLEFPDDFSDLESLKELNMSNNKLAEIKQGKLVKLKLLEVLNLASNWIEQLESIEGVFELK